MSELNENRLTGKQLVDDREHRWGFIAWFFEAGKDPDADCCDWLLVRFTAQAFHGPRTRDTDTLRAVPKDYDKMAAHEPEAAIWVVKNREGAHDVLEALNDPAEGPVRVEKEYSRNSPPRRFNIDEPGLSDVVAFQYLRDSMLE